jgi:hypothetical protein
MPLPRLDKMQSPVTSRLTQPRHQRRFAEDLVASFDRKKRHLLKDILGQMLIAHNRPDIG